MQDSQKKIGMAVIGLGGMGWHHARKVRGERGGKFEVIGSFDIREVRQEFARKNGLQAFESREALLGDPRIELVVVATPNDVHKEIVIDALRHGKSVICEKPVTMTCADLEDMIAVANETGMFFTVHQNRRWDPDYRTAKEVIETNSLGRVFNIESRVHGSRGIPGDWRNQKAHGGGMVLDWGIHMLDQMLQLMDGRRLLSLYAQLTFITNEECDDGFRVICNFEGGTSFMVEILTNNFINLPRWYINGENGTMIMRGWDHDGEIVKVSDWENRECVPIQAGVGITKTMAPRTKKTIKKYKLPRPKSDWMEYYDNIFDVIRSGAPPIVTHDQQRRRIRLCVAIFESGKTGKTIELE
jgi:predicted dehydrogenase